VIVLASGLIAATLVRLAPGFGIDERSFDTRLSPGTLASIAREHDSERNPLTFYVHYWTRLARGDFGRSIVYAQPIAPLLRERAPVTFRMVSEGLVMGWSAALVLAAAAALSGRGAVLLPALAVNGALLSVPSAVLATVCVLLRVSPGIAIAAVILPRIFPHAYEQLRAALGTPDVSMAKARGLAPIRIFLLHVLPVAAPPLLALVGISITLACGAAIPVEALADSPGLGQLAWRAALGRDLPILVTITLLLAMIATFSNIAADLVLSRVRRKA